MFVLIVKILVQFLSCKCDELSSEKLDVLLTLVDLMNLKQLQYLNFLRIFFRHTIPTNYSEKAQKQVFMAHLQLFQGSVDNYCKVSTNEKYLRTANYFLALPILQKMFESGPFEHSFLFSSEVIQELLKLVSGNDTSNTPAWVHIDLTILLDYIMAKVDFKTLPPEALSNEIQTFLMQLLHFSWKNIVKKQVTAKMLVNLSKLLVSRIKHKSFAFNSMMDRFIELYRSVLHDIDDVVDDETKQVWLAICDVILPEIQQNTQLFEENV